MHVRLDEGDKSSEALYEYDCLSVFGVLFVMMYSFEFLRVA